KDFTAYADVCFRQFGDRVSYWTTVNEPNAFANLGYDYGIAPPQRCSSINHCSRGNSSTEPYITVHHVLLAHASVARLYRKKYQDKQRGYIGVNIFAFGLLPLTNSTEDAIATQRYYDFLIGWMANPLVYGDYPKIMKQNVGSRLPAFSDRESKQVKGSADFLGVINYYIVYVKDNPSSLNKKLRDWNADSATEIFCTFST
ncbi:hypothetical protein CISIN_1g0121811mg, partial [Citrus sinensis]